MACIFLKQSNAANTFLGGGVLVEDEKFDTLFIAQIDS